MAIEAMEIEAMAQRPGRDIVTPIVTVAAILLFLAVGGVAFSRIVATYVHNAAPPERALTVALILNIALILFGWRRHTALSHELGARPAGEERAHALAASDPLTGFLNRRSLTEPGAMLFAQAQRRKKALALLLFDLEIGRAHV